jgi:hypothetical protein
MGNRLSQSQPSLNLSGVEFPLKQCLRTTEASALLWILAGTEISPREIRQALKKDGVLELRSDQSTFVLKLSHLAKQRGRYRCDIFARPVGFVA